MKKSDAHAFITQALQDYINTLPKAASVALSEKVNNCLSALAPVPEVIQIGDPPGATNG